MEKKALVSLDNAVEYSLKDKVRDGRFYVDQGIIAGCAGGGFENICAAADILKGSNIGNDAFTLSVYPASMPVYMELIRNGCAATLMETGAVMKTAFLAGPLRAGDTPANNAFSIRHSTRNFPNREGSKLQNGQIASVALMDARSIAATAANQGLLTPATDFDGPIGRYKYHFDSKIYQNRVFDSHGEGRPVCGYPFWSSNIKDWPKMCALPENLVLQVVSEIHDPVTTTDELIPSGQMKLLPFQSAGTCGIYPFPERPCLCRAGEGDTEGAEGSGERRRPAGGKRRARSGHGADLRAVPAGKGRKPWLWFDDICGEARDGSAREQAASCQKVLGGWANIANEYATKRYRSNLINWGMLPFVIEKGELPFKNHDYLFFPGIRRAVEEKAETITGYRVGGDGLSAFAVTLGELTDEERSIILKGCLINYNRVDA